MEIAAQIRARYSAAIANAYTAIPPGPPPRRKNRGGWTHFDRAAWNLASRFENQTDQILRMLDDTVVPFDNNEASGPSAWPNPRQIRPSLQKRNPRRSVFTLRSYIQTGPKHATDTLDNLTHLWTTTPSLPPPTVNTNGTS